MKFFPKGLTLPGIAIGAGAVLLAPIVIPAVAGALRPLLKAGIKGGILAYEGVKLSIAEAKESLEDLTAEAKAEAAKKNAPEKKTAKKA